MRRALSNILLTVLLMCGQSEPCSEYGCPHPPPHQPFVPALPGHTPRCAKPGQTFCESLDHYPQQLIRFLIDKWSFDYRTLLTDESRDEFNSYRSNGTRISRGLRVPQTGSSPIVSTTTAIPDTAIFFRSTGTDLRTSGEPHAPTRLQLPNTIQVAEQPILAAHSGNISSVFPYFSSASTESVPLHPGPGIGSSWAKSRLVGEQIRSKPREKRSAEEETTESFVAEESSPGFRIGNKNSHPSSGERFGPIYVTLFDKFAVHNAKSSPQQPRELDVRSKLTRTRRRVHPTSSKRNVRIGYLQRLVFPTNRLHK
ncbi:uncharacterized protein LOC105689348 isoform X2 [Athalia rosae]|uniref:uncharacterized protein LOC105689348 isoform X2 n=1 Tax=Athalia rosae TaxID=37344 RepID=UPI002033F5EA|nr:uncharacterized protein LOC105689348 isoform X2 [Athalia rosae]